MSTNTKTRFSLSFILFFSLFFNLNTSAQNFSDIPENFDKNGTIIAFILADEATYFEYISKEVAGDVLKISDKENKHVAKLLSKTFNTSLKKLTPAYYKGKFKIMTLDDYEKAFEKDPDKYRYVLNHYINNETSINTEKSVTNNYYHVLHHYFYFYLHDSNIFIFIYMIAKKIKTMPINILLYPTKN